MTEAEQDAVPKSMVVQRSSLGTDMLHLKKELRQALYPFTAMQFQEVNKNKLHDLVKTGENFGVKNLVLLTEKEKSCFLKLIEKD